MKFLFIILSMSLLLSGCSCSKERICTKWETHEIKRIILCHNSYNDTKCTVEYTNGKYGEEFQPKIFDETKECIEWE